jgi:cephalosporin-C deacetylase-like acetyl esterase
MSIIFFGSWFAQSVTGWTTYNANQVDHHQATVTWIGYVGSADFWEATLENWQSEFLAVGSFVAITAFLRQRGSSQSKPVGTPHDATGVEG